MIQYIGCVWGRRLWDAYAGCCGKRNARDDHSTDQNTRMPGWVITDSFSFQCIVESRNELDEGCGRSCVLSICWLTLPRFHLSFLARASFDIFFMIPSPHASSETNLITGIPFRPDNSSISSYLVSEVGSFLSRRLHLSIRSCRQRT